MREIVCDVCEGRGENRIERRPGDYRVGVIGAQGKRYVYDPCGKCHGRGKVRVEDEAATASAPAAELPHLRVAVDGAVLDPTETKKPS